MSASLDPHALSPEPRLFGGESVRKAGAAGLVAGAAGALFVALGDFGATWLWLPVWRDRLGLLVRLIATIVPPGAFIGALLVIAVNLAVQHANKRGSRAPYLWPIPFVLLSAPALRALAVKLCSGGMMARLRLHDALEFALSVVLPLALYAALVVIDRATRIVLRSPQRQRIAAAVLILSAFALGKINQVVLPNLYEYLHAALSVLAWFCAAFGALFAIAVEKRLGRVRRFVGGTYGAGALACALAAAFLLSLFTLNAHLNVRVAMFDARSPASRALLSFADPLLRRIEGRGPGRFGAFALTRGDIDTTGLPTQAGAHVVLITIDALRSDHLGAYGYKRPVSPGIDALAKESVVFERVYAQAPHSSYSLSSLHTSEYVHEVVELGRPLPEVTLAKVLSAKGYHTAAFFTDGIFHTEGTKLKTYRDDAFGFALYDHTNRESEDQTQRVLREADRIVEMGEPPSFLWVHYFDVHEPYQETTFGKGEMDRYDSEIKHVDRELTKLVKGLENKFGREVIVAITADHGEEFREHGGVYHGSTLYEEQVRVPFILHAAALPARRLAPPVEVIDVAPTLLGLLGMDRPKTMRGRDLRTIVLDRIKDPGPVFSAVLTKRMAVLWPYKVVADLRFSLFELYNLVDDPHERKNLADREPQKLREMKALVYAWLDSIEGKATGPDKAVSKYARELAWGRLGDRRAVEPMTRLLLDQKADTKERIEAGQILARLSDESSAPRLVKAITTRPPEVAAEAAIALGRMYDHRAADALRKLVYVEDPYVRARAAVSLGRLRDRAAVPALIDALWVAPTQYEREEAVRWLGRLRDRRAVEPLLSIIPEFNLRYLVSVALGMIGDPRAYDALADMLEWEHHTNIRDEVVHGLGLLGDVRIVPHLVDVIAREPELKNTAETLVRLGAIESGAIAGVDFNPKTKGVSGLANCQEGPLLHDWDYLNRTTCDTTRADVTVKLGRATGMASATDGAELIVRARRTDAPEAVAVSIRVGNRELGSLRFDGSFSEQRVSIERAAARPPLTVTLVGADPNARLALDHVLVVPRKAALAAAQ